MAARACWQGQIRLALVSIPVEIYTATKSAAKISFNQIHEPSGKRVKYEKVVPGIGPIDTDEIIKGYEVLKGEYVLLEDEEIEAVKIESRKTLELVQFVDQCEIDPLYFEKLYYVAPKDELAEEAFVVLREALRKAKKGLSASFRCAVARSSSPLSPAGMASCWRHCATPTRCAPDRVSSTILTRPSPRRNCSTLPPRSSTSAARLSMRGSSRIALSMRSAS